MEEEREDQVWCYFHPREMVTGICASCLKERLFVLASNQKHRHLRQSNAPRKTVPKIFALSSFVNPLGAVHRKSDDQHHVYDESASSTSHEDSFISIRFEDNEVASWDKGNMSKIPKDNKIQINHLYENDHNTLDKAKSMSMVEHARPRVTLRWRKRIGHLLQVVRWRRSAGKGKKLEGAKDKHGWMRFLTKRRTKE